MFVVLLPVILEMLKRALLTAVRSSLSNVRHSSSSVDVNEIRKFSQESAHWWKYSALERLKMNKVLVPYIREKVLATRNIQSLEGISIVDVVCRGGALSEALARTGATVTGIDSSEEMINIARSHKLLDPSIGSRLEYKNCTVDEMVAEKKKYDCAVVYESEHVENFGEFTRKLAEVVKPGGSIIITAINKSFISYWVVIVLLESVLRLGLHKWELFFTPAELQSLFDRSHTTMESLQGFLYDPLTGNFYLWPRTDVNYMAHFVKAKDSN